MEQQKAALLGRLVWKSGPPFRRSFASTKKVARLSQIDGGWGADVSGETGSRAVEATV
jgi:hypothetical protein